MLKMYRLGQLVLLVGLIGCIVGSCPDGWLHHETSCYHFSHDTEQWSNAFQICQILGGSLIEINDAAENAFIAGQLSSHGKDYEPFLAMSDLSEENVWVWMVSHTKLTSGGYANWASGEPNNSGGEDCVNMKHNGQWNDAECDSSRYYICETLNEDSAGIIG